jgi:septal ring factor EnvC (AmiA/AmiB activator)
VNEASEISKADLLKMVSSLAAMAAAAEARAEAANKNATDMQTSVNYWVAELNKSQDQVRELKQQVGNLSSPLADLARAAKETP